MPLDKNQSMNEFVIIKSLTVAKNLEPLLASSSFGELQIPHDPVK